MSKREWMLQAALAALGQNRIDGVALSHGVVTVSHLSSLYDAICAASPETPQEGAWVEHDGDVSKAPEAGRMVEVVYRDGSSYVYDTEEISWDHLGEPSDIMRWRYALPKV